MTSQEPRRGDLQGLLDRNRNNDPKETNAAKAIVELVWEEVLNRIKDHYQPGHGFKRLETVNIWPEDEPLMNVLTILLRDLPKQKPEAEGNFWALTATIILNTLRDLYRENFTTKKAKARQRSKSLSSGSSEDFDPPAPENHEGSQSRCGGPDGLLPPPLTEAIVRRLLGCVFPEFVEKLEIAPIPPEQLREFILRLAKLPLAEIVDLVRLSLDTLSPEQVPPGTVPELAVQAVGPSFSKIIEKLKPLLATIPPEQLQERWQEFRVRLAGMSLPEISEKLGIPPDALPPEELRVIANQVMNARLRPFLATLQPEQLQAMGVPARELSFLEIAKKLGISVPEFPPAQLQVLGLRMADLSLREIAKKLGISLDAAKQRYKKIKERIFLEIVETASKVFLELPVLRDISSSETKNPHFAKLKRPFERRMKKFRTPEEKKAWCNRLQQAYGVGISALISAKLGKQYFHNVLAGLRVPLKKEHQASTLKKEWRRKLPSPVVLVSGRRLGVFHLTKKVRESTLSTIWKADQQGVGEVLLKFIPKSEPLVGIAEHWIQQIICGLDCPNLLPYRLPFTMNGLAFNAIAEVTGWQIFSFHRGGTSVRDLLIALKKKGHSGMPRSRLIQRYMYDAAQGIDTLNQRGLLHRDIKPDNLIWNGVGVQVGYFDCLGTNDTRYVAIGAGTPTPEYAAPEVSRGERSPTADQFSLALTYYELRVGTLPPGDKDVDGRVSFDLRLLSPAERPIVARALSHASDQRFPTCTDFVQALANALHVPLPEPPAAKEDHNKDRGADHPRQQKLPRGRKAGHQTCAKQEPHGQDVAVDPSLNPRVADLAATPERTT